MLFAQSTIKLGHINSQDCYLPPCLKVTVPRKNLKGEAAAMQKTLEELQVEFNKKYEDYLKLTKDPNYQCTDPQNQRR